MTKLDITVRGRDASLQEAIEAATTSYNRDGVVEQLAERIELQNKLISKLLMVMFDDYGDEYTSRDYVPTTRAEQLAFILNGGLPRIEVNEV